MGSDRVTLNDHLAAHLAQGNGAAQGGLVETVRAIAAAVIEVADRADRAAFDRAIAGGGATNVHGEEQQPLDLVGNEIMLRSLAAVSPVAAVASEELPDVVVNPGAAPAADLLVAFDPLDGSSNLEVNVGVGTIFSVLPRTTRAATPSSAEFLQPGTAQLAAGFALYGPSTVLVLTLGSGAQAFRLDRATGEFVLTEPRLLVPEDTGEYAINGSNERFWEPPVQRYVLECRAGRAGPRGRDFNTRWVASLVAEAYRILTRGGVFLYPADTKVPGRIGRLRAAYEVNPIAFLVEQAGGRASTGRTRSMTEPVTELHQRAPFVFGSTDEVQRIERYHREADGAAAGRFDASLFNARSLFRVS